MSVNSLSLRLFLPLAALLVGCAAPFEVPEDIPSANRWEELEPNDSRDEAEETGFVLGGAEWFELGGTFANDTDDDYFALGLSDGTTAFEMVTFREYEGVEQQHTMTFPVTVLNIDADGSLGTQQLMAAAGFGADLDEDAASIVVRVSAREPDRSGTEVFAPYTNGKPYRVLIR